jgi:predicted transglutaminase-like cysteine proteinase
MPDEVPDRIFKQPVMIFRACGKVSGFGRTGAVLALSLCLVLHCPGAAPAADGVAGDAPASMPERARAADSDAGARAAPEAGGGAVPQDNASPDDARGSRGTVPQGNTIPKDAGAGGGAAAKPEGENAAGPAEADGAAGPEKNAGNDAGAATGGATTPPKPPLRLIGTVEFRSQIRNLPKWERVMAEEEARPTFVGEDLAVDNPQLQERWKALRAKLKDAPLMEKIRGVNNFFNQWPYKLDPEAWGVEDYWATPREFMGRSGDCEDYAIAKFYALINLGVPKEQMRIAAVKDGIRGLGHAVLVVFMDDDAYVLDNLTNLVLSHKKLTHYAPQYTVNKDYMWRHVKPKPGSGS